MPVPRFDDLPPGPGGGVPRFDDLPAGKNEAPIDPVTMPPDLTGREYAKDIGRGIVRGGAQALEAPPFQPPGTAGQFVQSPGETAEAIEGAKGTGPAAFTAKHVAPPQTTAGQYAEPITAGALTAPLQPGGPITKAVTTIAGGAGAKAGADLAGELDMDPGAGAVVGGAVGGAVGGFGSAEAAAARARRPSILPNSEMNRQASKAAIHAVERSGTVLDTSAVSDFLMRRPITLENGQTATGFLDAAKKMFFTPQRGGVALDAAKQIEDAGGDLATVMNVHGSLGTVKPIEGPNYAAAVWARQQIRDWVGSNPKMVSGDPQFAANWARHRDTWRVHSNLEEIEGAMQSAEWRQMSTGQGSNINTIRQNIKRILDNDSMARRYTPEARQQMAHIVEGDLARNSLRRVAGFAPHSAVTAVPALWELTMHGTGAATGFIGVTFLAHFLRDRLEQRSLNQLLDIIKVGSPLHTPAMQAARARLMVPRTAVSTARGALAGGPLAPQDEVAEPSP